MLIQDDLGEWPVKLREINSAGEPLNPEVIDQVRRAWGLTICAIPTARPRRP